jgi:transposase
VKLAREQWRKDQPALESARLVFLDETGVITNMIRRYGPAPKGKGCVDKVPHGHWQTSTFIAASRSDGLRLLDGPRSGLAFLEYVRQVLGPTLQPGDLVIADNLSCHMVAGVREAIEARGASLLYLPPYSPDLNPIENFFSKLKALLRKAAQRNFDGLLLHIARSIDSLSPNECSNYFRGAGYVIF